MKKYTPGITKQCKQCRKHFNKNYYSSWKEWGKQKYCSPKCASLAYRGTAAWNKGKTGYMSKKGRERIAETQRKRLLALSPEKMKIMLDKVHKIRRKRNNYTGTLGRTKELCYAWKGNNAGYSSKHKWIQKHWTKTGTCESCGLSPEPYGKRRWGTEWHSIDHKYNREDKNTWIEVCKSCHLKLDKCLIQDG